ncbi:acyl-CoA dehydrogenase, partial [Pseudomonas sp. MWU13-2860]
QFDAFKPEIDRALAEGNPEWALMWQRDQSVMQLAAGARAKRLAKALAVG